MSKAVPVHVQYLTSSALCIKGLYFRILIKGLKEISQTKLYNQGDYKYSLPLKNRGLKIEIYVAGSISITNGILCSYNKGKTVTGSGSFINVLFHFIFFISGLQIFETNVSV